MEYEVLLEGFGCVVVKGVKSISEDKGKIEFCSETEKLAIFNESKVVYILKIK